MFSANTFYRYARILHVYISATLFTLLTVFSITGILLNHPEWFETTPSSLSTEARLEGIGGNLIAGAAEPNWQPDLNAVLSYFQNRYSLDQADSILWDRDYGEISLDFSAPGGYAQIYLNTQDGSYEMLSETTGWIEILNDLHKGRYSGGVWSLVIDLTAVFIILFSITGIIILANSRRFRKLAFTLLALGTLTPALIVWIWVPAITITN